MNYYNENDKRAGSATGGVKMKYMTKEQAEQKAQEWSNLIADAEWLAENERHGASERLLAEARVIEKEVESAGYEANQLLRQIESRRRAL